MAPLTVPANFRFRRFFSHVGGPLAPLPNSIGDAAGPSVLGTPRSEETTLKKKSYENNRVFQDTWAAKLPWAESVIGEDGGIHQVRCLICTKIEGREKLLVPKLDSLMKHAGRRKAKSTIVGVCVVGQYYISKECIHVKNEALFLATNRDTVVEQLAYGVTMERKKKLVQFACLFVLLRDGRPISDYSGMQQLTEFLHVPNYPRKHWSASTGWGMAECLHQVVLDRTRDIIQKARYISVSCNEVTTPDQQSWVSIHCYVLHDWGRMPMLLTLTRLVEGATSDNLKAVILLALEEHGGLTKDDIGNKLICFGADGVSVFQGVRTGVTVQLKQNLAPFLIGVHCMSHRTNLAVQTLSKLPLVGKIEDMMQSLYTYFSHSPKRCQELADVADIVETGGNRLLRNVKTRWISMLAPAKRVLSEYRAVVLKMHKDKNSNVQAKTNLAALCDLECLLGLACLIPMMQALDYLIKFSQSRNCFIGDMVAAVKICQGDMYEQYIDPMCAFTQDHVFRGFKDIVRNTSEHVVTEWVPDVNSNEENLSIRVADSTILMHVKEKDTNKYLMITPALLQATVSSVQLQCSEAGVKIVDELEKRFPTSEVMDALGIVYPQYWVLPTADATFTKHLEILKAFYGTAKTIEDGSVLPPLVDARLLDAQSSFFKMSMKSNSVWAMENFGDINPLSMIWQKLSINALLASKLSEFHKLAEMAVVQIMGSVEDERVFSTLSFMKTKLRNKLTDHLDLTVRMFCQNHWRLDNFPFDDAFAAWKQVKDRSAETSTIVGQMQLHVNGEFIT